ncbi:MAG: hypothetical protein SGBAC_002633 [Bacillariaceae sp.]
MSTNPEPTAEKGRNPDAHNSPKRAEKSGFGIFGSVPGNNRNDNATEPMNVDKKEDKVSPPESTRPTSKAAITQSSNPLVQVTNVVEVKPVVDNTSADAAATTVPAKPVVADKESIITPPESTKPASPAVIIQNAKPPVESATVDKVKPNEKSKPVAFPQRVPHPKPMEATIPNNLKPAEKSKTSETKPPVKNDKVAETKIPAAIKNPAESKQPAETNRPMYKSGDKITTQSKIPLPESAKPASSATITKKAKPPIQSGTVDKVKPAEKSKPVAATKTAPQPKPMEATIPNNPKPAEKSKTSETKPPVKNDEVAETKIPAAIKNPAEPKKPAETNKSKDKSSDKTATSEADDAKAKPDDQGSHSLGGESANQFTPPLPQDFLKKAQASIDASKQQIESSSNIASRINSQIPSSRPLESQTEDLLVAPIIPRPKKRPAAKSLLRLLGQSHSGRSLKKVKSVKANAEKPSPGRAKAQSRGRETQSKSKSPARGSPSASKAKLLSEGPPTENLEGGWPEGWVKRVYERASGVTKGSTDKYWYTPINGLKLRSIVEVRRFLKALKTTNGNENEAKKIMKTIQL